MELSKKTCTPCRGGIPPLERDRAEALLRETPGWNLAEDGGLWIKRNFKFANFGAAMKFACAVGELAEEEGHHPDIHFGWGYCSVNFQTHKIKGLHENDFIMAAKVNSLASAQHP
ncbi:MAG: 4a-hydroxytetrahydrobiopterin dehydratase [Burkholderiales bacterium]